MQFRLGITRLLVLALLGLSVSSFIALLDQTAPLSADGHVRELVVLDEGQFPEGISVASDGTVLVGIVSTGEILRITPNGTTSVLGQLSLPEGGLLIGIKATDSSNAFALVNSSDQSNGVWHVSQAGSVQIAELPGGSLLNAVTRDSSDRLLVTDSIGGRIFSVRLDGSVETWLQDPLLLGNVEMPGPLGFPIGVNGIVLTPAGDAAFVANSEKAQILRIAIGADGSAGAISVVASDPLLGGADGIDLDAQGTLYVAVNGQNQVVTVDPVSGQVSVIASGSIFRFPAVVRLSPDQHTLYATNFDAPVLFGLAEGPARTGVLAIDLEAVRTAPAPITPPSTGSGGLANVESESHQGVTGSRYAVVGAILMLVLGTAISRSRAARVS